LDCSRRAYGSGGVYAGLGGIEVGLDVDEGGTVVGAGLDVDVLVGLGADDDVIPRSRSRDWDLSVRLLESRSVRLDSLVDPRPSFL